MSHGAAARSLHQEGRLAEADTMYRDILRAAPHNVEVLHLAAILALQMGKPSRSVALLGQAVYLGSRSAAAYSTLAAALRLVHCHDEALASCEAAIAIRPGLAEAHFNQALVLQDLERHADAVDCYERAIALKPDLAEAYCNRGLALLALRRLEEALASCDRAVALKPDYAAAWANRAAVLVHLLRYADALASHDRAIALNPSFAEAYADRGVVLVRLDRPMDALASYDMAIALKPDHAGAYSNRGSLLADLRRQAEALASYDRALAIKPDFAAAWSNRGLVLADLERPVEALASHERAIALQPDYAEAYYNRGLVLLRLNRAMEALASHDRAIELKPDYAEAYSDRGLVLATLNRHDEARASHEHAIGLKDSYAAAYSNRGLVLADMLRHDDALLLYDRAMSLQPDLAEAHWNKAISLLVLGQFQQGWQHFEWRRRLKSYAEDVTYPGPMWSGQEPIAGKTLLLHWEQGFGDTIQFCRYAALAAARGAHVLLSVQDQLRSLLRQLGPDVEVIDRPQAKVAFHYHAPLMSLPLAFGTTLETIPAAASYLSADPGLCDRWRARLPYRGKRRIGLAWRGNPLFRKDFARSMGFPVLQALLDEDADWICLLQQLTEPDMHLMAADGRMTFLCDELSDFSDTAALIECMDLVVSVDTSIAHLAGAMGKPVWVLLPYAPDWRWLLDRDDSPWYPSARLFRQRKPGDWQGVIEAVRRALAAVAR